MVPESREGGPPRLASHQTLTPARSLRAATPADAPCGPPTPPFPDPTGRSPWPAAGGDHTAAAAPQRAGSPLFPAARRSAGRRVVVNACIMRHGLLNKSRESPASAGTGGHKAPTRTWCKGRSSGTAGPVRGLACPPSSPQALPAVEPECVSRLPVPAIHAPAAALLGRAGAPRRRASLGGPPG